ncbi:hypothetical protein C1646_683464 [Rhizophagus diaphanus]|nr:hypothetical protein C1646_683464 [Rhizophagus diaphanus] [Rhizophagus sp. MUCL 43196]
MKENELLIKQQEIEQREKAKLWNTCFDVICLRVQLATRLTVLQDLQGEKALIEQEILMIPLTSNTKKKKVDKLKDKIRKLSPQIDEILSVLPSLKITPYYITEKEHALELRPNKRTVNINRNLNPLLLPHPIKRARISDLSESRIDTSSTLSG